MFKHASHYICLIILRECNDTPTPLDRSKVVPKCVKLLHIVYNLWLNDSSAPEFCLPNRKSF